MVRASSGFVGFLSTSLPCQMVTGVSDGFAPNLSSKVSAPESSSSSTQTWGRRLRAANSLRRVASLEWREPIILRPTPILIRNERLARKVSRMMFERSNSSVTASFSRSRGIASTSPPTLTTAERGTPCPVSMCRSPKKVPGLKPPHPPRLAGEVVYYLYHALEDDEEVVGGVARPEEDLPGLRLSRLPVAPEDLDLVFTQRRWPRDTPKRRRSPRTPNLTGSISHCAPTSIALVATSMMLSNTVERIF